MTASLPSRYFDDLYANDPDPWGFATSAYERDKYDATIAALPGRIDDGLEIGCSIGVLTQRLAPHCERLLAIDPAELALAQARERCAAQLHVVFARMRVPQDWPEGRFDFMLFSEVLYYLSPGDLSEVARLARGSLRPGGTALLVHYTPGTDYPLSGDRATALFIEQTGFIPNLQLRRDRYRLDRLQS